MSGQLSISSSATPRIDSPTVLALSSTSCCRPLLAPGALVITESAAREPLELALPKGDERRYGDTLIRIHPAPGAAGE